MGQESTTSANPNEPTAPTKQLANNENYTKDVEKAQLFPSPSTADSDNSVPYVDANFS